MRVVLCGFARGPRTPCSRAWAPWSWTHSALDAADGKPDSRPLVQSARSPTAGLSPRGGPGRLLTAQQAREVRAFATRSGQAVSAAARELLAEGLEGGTTTRASRASASRRDRDVKARELIA